MTQWLLEGIVARRKMTRRVPSLPGAYTLAPLVLGLCLVAGCGGSSKGAHAQRSRNLDASAKMLVVSAPGALPIVEKGMLVGNFDAHLTVTLNNAGSLGAQSKHFDISMPEGSITGQAKLASYTLGRPIVAEYPASIAGGSGAFAHAKSSNLLFRTEATGLPGEPDISITITVTGTLSY
jgi:hypothetical protein